MKFTFRHDDDQGTPLEGPWRRGDYVYLRKTQQSVVASDAPSFGGSTWIVAEDPEDWEKIGTFVDTVYVDSHDPILVSHRDRDDVTEPTRVKVLAEAMHHVTGDRNQAYGEPYDNFGTTAELATIQFRHLLKENARFNASHVAQFMSLVKLARMITSARRDHWVDLAGYAGCGAECSEYEEAARHRDG